MSKTIYDFSTLDFNLNTVNLSQFEGKVLLIVNTASKCIFNRQFKSLEKLYQEYKDQGFEVLAFPSNDFGNQEPKTGRNLEIHCRVNQQVTYPVFKRIHVVGEFADPIYKFLYNKNENGHVDVKPIWNFHKYLVNKNGEVVDSFYPTTGPMNSKIKNKIEALLQE